MGRVLGLAWDGALELVEQILYIFWDIDVQYSGLAVPVQCDSTLETPCTILFYFIFFLECIY